MVGAVAGSFRQAAPTGPAHHARIGERTPLCRRQLARTAREVFRRGNRRQSPASFWWWPAVFVAGFWARRAARLEFAPARSSRSEEHTSELQSLRHLVC